MSKKVTFNEVTVVYQQVFLLPELLAFFDGLSYSLLVARIASKRFGCITFHRVPTLLIGKANELIPF